jgi:hypothetical protein
MQDACADLTGDGVVAVADLLALLAGASISLAPPARATPPARPRTCSVRELSRRKVGGMQGMLKVEMGQRGYARRAFRDNNLTGSFPPELFELEKLTQW